MNSSISLPTEPLAVGVNQLADLTGFSRAFIWREIADGHLKAHHKGRRCYVIVSEAKDWLQSDNTQAGGAA